MTAVCRAKGLGGDQDDVHQVADEEEAQGGELQEAHGRVAEVESVHTEHPEEDGDEEGGVKVVSICELAGHLLEEGVVTGALTNYPRDGSTLLLGKAGTVDNVTASQLLGVRVNVFVYAEELAGEKSGAVYTVVWTVLLALDSDEPAAEQ